MEEIDNKISNLFAIAQKTYCWDKAFWDPEGVGMPYSASKKLLHHIDKIKRYQMWAASAYRYNARFLSLQKTMQKPYERLIDGNIREATKYINKLNRYELLGNRKGSDLYIGHPEYDKRKSIRYQGLDL